MRHRRSYHRRVAETLEAWPALWAVRAQLPAVLTHHWERAEEWGRAAEWAMRAAEQARRAFAPAEAARLYERALTAARNSGDTAVTRLALSGLADAALVAGDADRALETLEQALALDPEPLERAALERRRGQAFARLGMQASAGDAFARAAVCLGEEQPDESDAVRAERSTLRIQAAFSHLARGAVLLARAAAEEVLRLHVGGGDEADALRLLGAIDRLTGNPAAAAERLVAALAIAEGIGDLPRQAVLHEQLGLARLAARDRAGGAAALHAALDLYRRLGDHCAVGRCLYELGVDALHAGAPADAITLLREAIKQADSGDDPALRGRAGLQLGRALALTGDWAAALAAFERAGADDEEVAGEAALERLLLEVSRGRTPEADLRATLAAADRAGQHHAAARARIGLATLARRAGHTEEARTHLRAALEQLADPMAETALLARAALAQVAAGEGNARGALKVAAQACALAEEHGPAATIWLTRRVYGAALDAAGAHEAAEQELRTVVEAARRAGARPELAAALSAWARVRRSLGDPTGAADALAELRDVAATLGPAGVTGAVP